MSSDMTLIRQWDDIDGHEKDRWGDWIWPRPPRVTEYALSGELRAGILATLNREDEAGLRIRLVETETEGGYSEWTAETDYDLEVWVDEGRQSQKVWSRDGSHRDNLLATFLEWSGVAS